jgi:hypothetical protein
MFVHWFYFVQTSVGWVLVFFKLPDPVMTKKKELKKDPVLCSFLNYFLNSNAGHQL